MCRRALGHKHHEKIARSRMKLNQTPGGGHRFERESQVSDGLRKCVKGGGGDRAAPLRERGGNNEKKIQ